MNFSLTLSEALEMFDTFMVTKKGCPFCIRAYDILNSHQIEYKEFDFKKYKVLDKDITEEHNHRTYPKIYLNKQWIGGCSDLYNHFNAEDREL